MLNEFDQPIGEPIPAWKPPPCPPHKVISGEYCRLEPLDAGLHARDLFFAYSQDAEGRGWTYLPYGPFHGLDSFCEWIESTSESEDPQFYSIVDRALGTSLGVVSYLRISPEHGSIEVGHIHFSPALMGTIAATEAMFLMMRNAFELGYRRYEWKCDSLNLASRRAAQRLGLSFEGVFRQATLYKGRNRDTAWFAATDRDWPVLKEAFEQWLARSNFDKDGTQRQRLSSLVRPVVSNLDPALQD